MNFTVNNFVDFIEKLVPLGLQESWDNTGFALGCKEKSVENIMIALDCTEDVIDEAIEKNCGLIFTHHPLIFSKPKSITGDTLQGRKIMKALEAGIAVYSAHTNLDSVKDGLGDIACDLIADSKGEAIYPKNSEKTEGVGRIFDLKEEISFEEYIDKVKDAYEASHVRVCGDMGKKIKRVAVINGSGEDMVEDSFAQGAQCVVTGDIKYHFMSDFKEMGICIIDVGHFEVEWKIFKEFVLGMESDMRKAGFQGNLVISEKCVNPYIFK